MCPISLK